MGSGLKRMVVSGFPPGVENKYRERPDRVFSSVRSRRVIKGKRVVNFKNYSSYEEMINGSFGFPVKIIGYEPFMN